MSKMTRELFEQGVKFKHKKHDLYQYQCEKSEDGNLYISYIRNYSSFSEEHFFANISQIDDKGFKYYTFLTLGKELKASIKFSDLVIIEENHTVNSDMLDAFDYRLLNIKEVDDA